MPIRVGLFGAGWAARTVHGPSLRDYRRRKGGIRLAAVCDVDVARAEAVRDAFGFEAAYGTVADALAEAGLDAAVLAVSTQHNAAVARACVAAGVPVLLEKPPAMTPAAVRALADAVRRRRGRVMVAFNRRWTPSLVKLRELVRQAGELQAIRADMRRVARTDPDFTTTAVHVVDAVRFVAGNDYEQLSFTYGRCGPSGQAAAFYATGTLAGGAVARLDVVPMAGVLMEAYTVVAGGRTLVARTGLGKRPDIIEVFDGAKRREIRVRTPSAAQHDTSGFYQEVAAFLDALRRGRPLPGPSLEESVQSIAVMAAMAKRRSRCRLASRER